MDLSEIKSLLAEAERRLAEVPFAVVCEFERDGRLLQVAVTDRLRKLARKAGVWKSREMLITLKNAAYGFDEELARSRGGRDGIFLLDRNFRPANPMMWKLFEQYLDKAGTGVETIAEELQVEVGELLPVRLVSHHLRLLGVLARREGADWLVLVDCDRS